MEFNHDELGGIRVLSKEAREKYYSDHKCMQPCTDDMAKTVERCRWLMYESLRLRFKKFISIACHDGGMERWMVDEFGFEKLVGMDLSFDAIQVARQMIQHRLHPEKAEFICCPYEEYTEGKGTWDGCSAFELIEHFPDEENVKLFNYMQEMVRPGGHLFICTPNDDGIWGSGGPVKNIDPHHINLFTVEKLHKFIEATTGKKPHFVNYTQGCPHLMCMVEN